MLRLHRDHTQAHLLAEMLAEHRAEIADAVGKAERDGLFARPEGAGEQVRVVGQRGTAALLDQVDEGGVDVLLDRAQAGDVLLALRAERIEHRLALAGGMDAALDADALHQPVKPKPAETTPIDPTIEPASTTISSPAAAIM